MADDVHTDFDAAFTDGVTLVDNDAVRYKVRTVKLGDLPIRSGAIGVGDAFTGLSPVRPPSGTVPPGIYPVELSVVRFEDEGGPCVKGDERVAAARVRLSAERVQRWSVDSGAGVDSGTCAFIDGDAQDWTPSEAEGEALQNALEAEAVGLSARAACRVVDGRTVVAFSSGYGDGVYASYWGLDAGGAPAVLCLDFEVLITDVTVDVPLGWPLRRGGIRDPRLRQHGVAARVPWLGAHRLIHSYGKDHFAYARWHLPDETWRRLSGKPSGRNRRSHSLSDRPDGAELTIRIAVGQRPCGRAPAP